MAKYKGSTAEEDISIINLRILETEAAKIIEKGAMSYIQSGAEDEYTLKRNETSFDERQILPRMLSGVEKVDTSTSFMGVPLSLPILMAPAAAHGLAHQDGEVATAKGVAAVGSMMCISNYANKKVEDIASAGNGAPQIFQIYMSNDDGFNRYLLEKVHDLGMKAIILTADVTTGGNREADIVNKFKFPLSMPNIELPGDGGGKELIKMVARARQRLTPNDISSIASISKLPVIVKGIQCPEDALLATGAGAAAVYVSNHGGRQLDGAPGSFEVLEEIAAAVNKRIPIILDSGIRRGQHVFKALACGADVVSIGRPAIYGLALGGPKGVAAVFEHLKKELATVMQLAGCQTIEDIKNAYLL